MDSVYFYNEKLSKDITSILKDDNFRHISYIIRDSSNTAKKGYFLYVKALPEDLKLLDGKLKDVCAEKVEGEEEKKIIDTIKAEEENAASGMGIIFG
jgi:hypothetical protein